jgi:hypothetical protein
MPNDHAVRIPIRFTSGYRKLMICTLLRPSHCDIRIGSDIVAVRFSWGFSARIPRSFIRSVRRVPDVKLTAGVHGWRGRWLVNGAVGPLVELHIEPPVRALLCGLPILRVRSLQLSVDDPDEFVDALGVPVAST